MSFDRGGAQLHKCCSPASTGDLVRSLYVESYWPPPARFCCGAAPVPHRRSLPCNPCLSQRGPSGNWPCGVLPQDPSLYEAGWTPLMAAAVADRVDVAERLLRAAGSTAVPMVTAANRYGQVHKTRRHPLCPVNASPRLPGGMGCGIHTHSSPNNCGVCHAIRIICSRWGRDVLCKFLMDKPWWKNPADGAAPGGAARVHADAAAAAGRVRGALRRDAAAARRLGRHAAAGSAQAPARGRRGGGAEAPPGHARGRRPRLNDNVVDDRWSLWKHHGCSPGSPFVWLTPLSRGIGFDFI